MCQAVLGKLFHKGCSACSTLVMQNAAPTLSEF